MSDIKQLRGQVRQVVKELLNEELIKQVHEILAKQISGELKKIEEETRKTMHEMNERHKNTMGFLVRNVTTEVKKS